MKSLKYKSGGQRGQAVLELALVLPLLVLIMAAICDLGRAMTRYSAHVGIVRDAANLGSRIIDLDPSSVVTAGSSIQQLGPGAAGHLLMHYRARQLLLLRDRSIDFSKVQLTSRYDNVKQLVTFSMTLSFPTIFGAVFGTFPITSKVTFPYSMASGQQGGVAPPSDGCDATLSSNWGNSDADNSGGSGGGVGGAETGGGGDMLFGRVNGGSTMKVLPGGGGGGGGGKAGMGEAGAPLEEGNPAKVGPQLGACLKL